MSDQLRKTIYEDITDERWRQIEKWGPQTHPDGMGAMFYKMRRNQYTNLNDERVRDDEAARWGDILLEEVYEAMSEPANTANLRKELIQSAAVIVAWLEDLDGRGAGPDARP